MSRLRDMSDEQLVAEWHVWNNKARTSKDHWVITTADGFRKGVEAEMRDRGVPIPLPQTTEKK